MDAQSDAGRSTARQSGAGRFTARQSDAGRSTATFVELCVSPDLNPAADALELHLPHGHRVVVRPGFDCQTLLNLLATLERHVADVALLERNGTRSASCRTHRGTANGATPEAGA